MTFEEIKNPAFNSNGRGLVKVQEVQEYVDSVIEVVSQLNAEKKSLQNENVELIEKYDSMTIRIEQYTQDEENIKLALLNAQRMASKTLKQAQDEAQEIRDNIMETVDAEVEEKKKKADAYYHQKTQQADELFTNAKKDYELKMSELERKTFQVLEAANKKAEFIVSDANIRSAAALERANAELEHLSKTTDELLNKAKKNLAEISAEAARCKKDMASLLAKQIENLNAIEILEVEIPEADETDFEMVYSIEDVDEAMQQSSSQQQAESVPAEKSEKEESQEDIEKSFFNLHMAQDEFESAEKSNEESSFETMDRFPLPQKERKPEISKEERDFFSNNFVDITENSPKAEPVISDPVVEQMPEEESKQMTPLAFGLESVDKEEDSADDYTQPALFESDEKDTLFKEQVTRYTRQEEKGKSFDNEPLKFGKGFDIFNDDDDDDGNSQKGTTSFFKKKK